MKNEYPNYYKTILRQRGKIASKVAQLEKNVNVKDKKIMKVKLLKSFIAGKDKKSIAKELAEKTKSEVVQVVGFTITLYKNKTI